MVQYSGALDGYVFAIQVTAKKAHSTFGQAGSNAIRDEIQSLLRKKVFSAVVKSNLSDSQRKKIIRMSCFVRDKRDANGNLLKIKARLVAGGHIRTERYTRPSKSHRPQSPRRRRSASSQQECQRVENSLNLTLALRI